MSTWAGSTDACLVSSLFAAAAIAVIAVFMPWIKITVPFIGSITAGPTQGVDGFIIIGVIAVTVALAWFNRRTGALVAAGAAAILVAYKVIDLIAGVSDASEAAEGLVATSYQAGLYLAVVAVIALVAFAVRNRKESNTTPIATEVEKEAVEA